MKKKAAIVTWCYDNGKTNYGQILQCYAVQQIIKKKGYEPVVVKYRRVNSFEKINPQKIPFSFRKIYEVWYKVHYIEGQLDGRIWKFYKFIRKHIHTSPQCYSKTDIERVTKDCDVLICGSDQIWNPLWFDDVYALNFGNRRQKRIAYAASGVLLQDKEYEDTYMKLAKLLESFDIITVREKQSIEILKSYTDKKISDILDPTLQLSAKEWDEIASEKLIKEPYIFCYTLGEIRLHKKILKEIMKQYQAKKVIYIGSNLLPNQVNDYGCFESYQTAGPAEFISLIKYAEAVCTDSFHGIAMSVVYDKKFYILSRNQENGSKIGSDERQNNLLKKLGREEKTIKCIKDLRG